MFPNCVLVDSYHWHGSEFDSYACRESIYSYSKFWLTLSGVLIHTNRKKIGSFHKTIQATPFELRKSESISSKITHLDNSDFVDLLDDDLDINPTYQPGGHSAGEDEDPDDADEEDPALQADPGPETSS
ncbi:hypothetical protein J6590_078524 [Homalodisca vitripennis]|nr:hypothetical protein J6590_078524 [Homalodisca vitripennis]